MDEFLKFPLLQVLRERKPAKAVRIERTPDEWKKLINDAKQKETFWTKGIIPGSTDSTRVTTDDLDEE